MSKTVQLKENNQQQAWHDEGGVTDKGGVTFTLSNLMV